MGAFLAVGLGGMIGACLRYGAICLFEPWREVFPFATLTVNIIAGFISGFIVGLESQSHILNEKLRVFVTTGCMGGLGTFSAFNMDTIELFEAKRYFAGFGNVFLNVGLTFASALLGMLLAKALFKKSV